MMDIVQHCLSLVPVPYLVPAFSALRFIWSSIQNIKINRRQVEALAKSIAQLLQMLQREYLAGRLREIVGGIPGGAAPGAK